MGCFARNADEQQLVAEQGVPALLQCLGVVLNILITHFYTLIPVSETVFFFTVFFKAFYMTVNSPIKSSLYSKTLRQSSNHLKEIPTNQFLPKKKKRLPCCAIDVIRSCLPH